MRPCDVPAHDTDYYYDEFMMTGEGAVIIVGLLLAVFYVLLGRRRPGIALITAPILCTLFVSAAFLTEDEGTIFQALLLIPLILVAALASILLSRRELDEQQWPQKCARLLLWSFAIGLFVLTVFVTVLNVPSFGFFALLLFICAVGFVGAAINFGLTSRHTTATYVISTIGASMRQNLPLPMALESAAGGRSDARSRILRSIRKWLVLGCSVTEAIRRGYPKCPSYATAMIAAAEPINQLPHAFRSIEADMAARFEESRQVEPVQPFYPLVLLCIVGFQVWGILTFVMPNFSLVLTEMTEGAQLPAATRLLIGITSFIAWDHGALFGLALAFVVLVVVPLSIYLRFRQRRPGEPYLLSRMGDFFKWHLPVTHWFEKNYAMVQATGMLRLSLNAGRTVNDAIANALDLDVNNCVRKRLERWLERVEAGENIAEAAKQSGLGGGLAWAFDQQSDPGNTLTVLETLESLYRANYSYCANLIRFIMGPCVTVVMGTIVGFVVYAIFSAPVAIIHAIAESVYP